MVALAREVTITIMFGIWAYLVITEGVDTWIAGLMVMAFLFLWGGICTGIGAGIYDAIREEREKRREMDAAIRQGWTCHICGLWRPNDRISVRVNVAELAGIEYPNNVRYCNDSEDCIEKSKSKVFLGELKEVGS